MNILENHIIKIHSEKPMTRKEWIDNDYKNYIKVDITIDCHGILERKTRVFHKDEWEEVKKFGYYLA